MTACGYWCKTMFIVLERSRGCIMTLEGSVVYMQNRKPATSHILISTLFHKRNWDDSRMIRREWIIDTPPKIRWSQIIIRTMIITMITIVNNSYASFVLSKLPACFISRWTHTWRMNQLFYNIFDPLENFFSRGICLLTSWACTIGIWSTFSQLNSITQIY